MKLWHMFAFWIVVLLLLMAVEMTGILRRIPENAIVGVLVAVGILFVFVMNKRAPKA